MNRILNTIRQDKKPFCRLLGILLLGLPFDIGSFLRITIRVQDYYIRLHSSLLSIAFWCNPNERFGDYKFITSYLKQTDVYIDVGANIGTTLIPAAKLIKVGKAIGIEPHPKIYSYLKDNMLLNDLENRVELHNCALGNEHGYLHFSSKIADDQNRVLCNGKGIKVPTKLLDDFGEIHSLIDLIKIDVEGYEKFVIEGGMETLKKTECVYIEISEKNFSRYGYSVKDLLVVLERMGFFLFIKKKPEVIEPVNCEYRPSRLLNLFAIRNIENFIERTGWRICDKEA